MPTIKWLESYHKYRSNLISHCKLDDYFTSPAISSRKLEVIDIGPVTLPNGSLIVCDPLAFLTRTTPAFYRQSTAGTFQTKLCVIVPEDFEVPRYAAAKVTFSDHPAVVYEEALLGSEDLSELEEEGEFFGFIVRSGLVCLCDKTTRDAYCDYVENWRYENPKKNLYDDLFAPLLKKSAEENPTFQRNRGDYLNFKIPNTEYYIPIFSSGSGDGIFPCYFGLDEKDDIVSLIIQFLDIEHFFSNI
jgi:hypothetical protein